MRHRKSGRKLNRSWEHRKAMFKNMAGSLVTHESIQTTEARAKELRKVMDRLVTLALRNDLHARRQAYKILAKHSLVKRLFDEIGPRFAGIPGGYTRVVKLGLPRLGDCASMAVIEFTRKSGEEVSDKKEKPKKKAKAAPEKKAAKTKAKEKKTVAPEKEKAEAEVKEAGAAEPEEAAAVADAPVEAEEAAPVVPEETEEAVETASEEEAPEETEEGGPEDPGEDKK